MVVLPSLPGQDWKMRYLRKIDRVLVLIEKVMVVFLFSALILFINVNIVSRNLFGISSHTILEISPTLVLWLALVGASLALRTGRHIKLEVVVRYLPASYRLRAHQVTSFFGLAVMAVLFLVSLGFVKNEVTDFGVKGYFSLIFPLFFALSMFRYLLSLLDGVLWDEKNAVGPGKPDERAR
jgi:TRAP-type C4-dicarboxylate transport system permease small subunit